MTKSAVADWSTTAANNTDVGGVNIAEGMSPSGVNDAMREIMAQIATLYTIIQQKNANNQIVAAAGTASLPSWSFLGDVDTGFWNISSGAVGFTSNGTERMRLSGTAALFGRTSTSLNASGVYIDTSGVIRAEATSAAVFDANRLSTDGDIIRLFGAGTEEGAISVSGTTVTYGSFAGSHWSQLADNATPAIPRGTVIETIDAMCEWPGEANDQLVKSRICDTAASPRVYGVFMRWDDTDMVVCALGAYLVRMAAGQTPAGGDLVEAAGGGCARVQSGTAITSATIGKVTSPAVIETYGDGSFLVPCVLYCG